MADNHDNLIAVGRITTTFGIKGWVKVHSATQESHNLLAYQPWWLKMGKKLQCVEVDAARETAKGLQCHIKGYDTPEDAKLICQQDIWVDKALFPELAEDEFYWHQLEGLQVVNCWEGETTSFGRVVRLYETGANDVLVVKASRAKGDIDDRERWLPYIDQVVQKVDIEKGQMEVVWDPEF